MLYPDQPTPPFNSPYQQHASRPGSLLESRYPSPVQQEPQSKYPQGLGLYEVQPAFPNGLPPSPQPSESWGGQFHNGSSPGDLANPYLSGAFDHPVSRSPLPWNHTESSPRSTVSPYTREMSAFSHDGSEHAYPNGVKVDTPAWGTPAHFCADAPVDINQLPNSRQTPLTVAPERLSAAMYSYEHAYTSPAMQRYEPALYDYDHRRYERAPSEGSIRDPHARNSGQNHIFTAVQHRETRNRRHTDPATAPYRCELCPDKGFARKYNLKQHMLIHEAVRTKSNVCPFTNCRKSFAHMKQMDVLVVNILGGESTTAPVCEPRYILTQWKPPLRRDKTTWQYI
ncbi:hypothetical protein DDE82_001268 [Stemphylium lycopersici]|uniref:C2H2-type domain-containing protein n=1 Tax=Stemphylium lycopersici TaxID=183478 RepID=A0A364ND43_STELY|nr:hypothetical protein TW65_06148 [Stemphylium lycopersici]RAR10459.1 hypothetical protein DDE82_001268 [Stemphylium lycopersici]RAR15172.1 hypothetical protein DDE83_001409 [Stemphylium lycopersici]